MLTVLSLTAQAEVYKSIGPDGSVVFTDQPTEGAEKVHIPPVPTYTAPKLPAFRASSGIPTEPATGQYEVFSISSPAPEATIRDNTGSVSMQLRISPPLQSSNGHRIQYQLDGVDQGEPTSATGMSYSNLDRGSHTLSAKLIGAGGEVIRTTPALTIFMHRPSTNLPARN